MIMRGSEEPGTRISEEWKKVLTQSKNLYQSQAFVLVVVQSTLTMLLKPQTMCAMVSVRTACTCIVVGTYLGRRWQNQAMLMLRCERSSLCHVCVCLGVCV